MSSCGDIRAANAVIHQKAGAIDDSEKAIPLVCIGLEAPVIHN